LWLNTYDGSLTSCATAFFKAGWNDREKRCFEDWLDRAVVAARVKSVLRFDGLLIASGYGASMIGRYSTTGTPTASSTAEDHHGIALVFDTERRFLRIADGRFEAVPKDAGLRGQDITGLAPGSFRAHSGWGRKKKWPQWDAGVPGTLAPDGETNLNVASLLHPGWRSLVAAQRAGCPMSQPEKWTAELNAWPDLMQEQQFLRTLNQDSRGRPWRTSRAWNFSHQRKVFRTDHRHQWFAEHHSTCWLEDQEGNLLGRAWETAGWPGCGRKISKLIGDI